MEGVVISFLLQISSNSLQHLVGKKQITISILYNSGILFQIALIIIWESLQMQFGKMGFIGITTSERCILVIGM